MKCTRAGCENELSGKQRMFCSDACRKRYHRHVRELSANGNEMSANGRESLPDVRECPLFPEQLVRELSANGFLHREEVKGNQFTFKLVVRMVNEKTGSRDFCFMADLQYRIEKLIWLYLKEQFKDHQFQVETENINMKELRAKQRKEKKNARQ